VANLRRHWVHLIHPLALLPFVLLAADALRGDLTANPIQAATQRTGAAAIALLVAGLACTPVAAITGWKRLLSLRRPLGLYGFGYAALHLAIFAVIDYGLDLGLIGQTIAEKPYVVVGFAAFLLLLPLAVTSTRGWQRRLGSLWKQLHRLVYLAVPLAVLHYLWLVKRDATLPVLYAVLVGALLLLRTPLLRAWTARRRPAPATASPRAPAPPDKSLDQPAP
jgi:methionine sulfoxide reductase heme-binding subunit